MPKKSNTPKPYNIWRCITCKINQDMTHAEMLTHLKDAHGLPDKNIKASRKMNMHLDGDTWFSSEYEFTIDCGTPVVLVSNSLCLRKKDDPMRFQG